MAITKEQKGKIIDKAREAMKKAVSLVFINFHGLTVADVNTLRKDLKRKSINYSVFKKTLLKRALEEKKFDGVEPVLDGEVALVYLSDKADQDDVIAPAREVYAFQKTHKDAVRIIGGVFESKYLDASAMMDIATIPSKEVLYGQFVGMLASPIRSFAFIVNQIAQGKQG